MERFKALCDAGLVVLPTPRDKIATSGRGSRGVTVHKPKSVTGNNRGHSRSFICLDSGEKIQTDAPHSGLLISESGWIHQVHRFVPGPGPGDFKLEFTELGDAIDSILDYYFGDPTRMNPTNYVYRKEWQRIYRTKFLPPVGTGVICCRKGCSSQTLSQDDPQRYSPTRGPETHACPVHFEEAKQLYTQFLRDYDVSTA